MNQNSFDLQPKEFLATKGGAAMQVFFFTALAAGSAWLAYASQDPKFWSDFSYVELDFIGSIMNLFPVMVRVLICIAFVVLFGNVIITKLQRNADGRPLLILSEAGVSGFAHGRANDHTFISWNDFKSATTINKSEMIFHAKPASLLGKRARVAVSLSEIGVKYADMVTLVEAYQAAWVLAQIQGKVFSNPHTPAKQVASKVTHQNAPSREDVAISTPVQTRRPEPQPGQFVKPNVPDFGRRMTRL